MGPVRVEIQGVMLSYLSGRLKDTNNFLHCDKLFHFSLIALRRACPYIVLQFLHSLYSIFRTVNACKNARWYPDCSVLPMRVRKPERFCSISLAVIEKSITSCIATDLSLSGLVKGGISLAPVPVKFIAILTLSCSLFRSVYVGQNARCF